MATNLEINYNSKYKDCCQKVHQVGKVLSVDSLSQSTDFVVSGGQQVA